MGKAKSSKPAKAKPAESNEIVVNYDLFDLPTAFHKAGLAGLVMLIESLKERHNLTNDDLKCVVSATTVEVTFTESCLRILMDDLYDAQELDIAVKNKWSGATVARAPTDAEAQAGTRFIYRVVQPRGTFLRENYPDEEGLWLKLWRDMLWNIPRSRPTTREPYKQCAVDKTCKEGMSAWSDLRRVRAAAAKNSFHTTEISSALLPGAQAVNAEGVPFLGRAEHNLLLHFWPLAVCLFVPQHVEVDGSTDFGGHNYTLAVPEVANVEQFVRDYRKMLNGLSKVPRGYRPAGAVIDIAAEGALAFFDHLAVVTGLQVESGQLKYSIRAVEYLHFMKAGNNVKTLAAGRVSPGKRLLAGYRQIVDPQDESTRFRNPLFRRGLLSALLQEVDWHLPFERILTAYDSDVFIRKPNNPAAPELKKRTSQFANNAAKKFRYEVNQFSRLLELKKMSSAERPVAPLPVIVNRVVRTYLLSKTKDKTGVEPDDFKNSEVNNDDRSVSGEAQKAKQEYNAAKQKLAESLFLEFRSRKDQFFVEHFAATFFSVTQRFLEAERLNLAAAMQNQRDELKTLTLLSISANS